VTGAGDAMVKETQQVLEEQCIRQGVVRRGNQIPLELVHRNQSICGAIILDMTTGQLHPLQAKTVIIADGGFEEAWNGSNYSGGLGMDLALRAGISLRDMEFIARSPLALSGTDIILPAGILNDGASLHSADGADLEITPDADMHYVVEKIQQTSNPVLDARGLKGQWWNGISKQISQRLGVEMDKQTLAISCKEVSTIGGIPVDENGRVVTEKWSRWFTGLYAAGDAACSGLHGAGMIVGNRLLDALAGGAAAGKHAGEWSQGANFSGRGELEAVIGAAEAELDLLFIEPEGDVLRSGSITADLTQVMDSSMGFEREEKGLSAGLEKLLQLSDTAEQIHCDDQSRLYNDNLRQILYLKAMIRLSIAATRSALARKESRGLHQRSDYPQIDNDQLHHTLVDKEGNLSSLAIRKGSSGTWLIAPNA
jgi:succinate dehydrogenase / fumarate reductase flavoprotein subunit